MTQTTCDGSVGGSGTSEGDGVRTLISSENRIRDCTCTDGQGVCLITTPDGAVDVRGDFVKRDCVNTITASDKRCVEAATSGNGNRVVASVTVDIESNSCNCSGRRVQVDGVISVAGDDTVQKTYGACTTDHDGVGAFTTRP